MILLRFYRILKINPANLENLNKIVVQDKEYFGFGRPKPKEYRQKDTRINIKKEIINKRPPKERT